MKKSQITFFIILGIIILVAAYFMFYFSSTTKEQQAGVETETASKELFSSARVKAFSTNCLSTALDEGLEVLGRQSGFITKDCKGSVFSGGFPQILYDRTVQPKNLFLDNRLNKCNESLNYSVIYLIRSNTPLAPYYWPSVNFTENGSATNLGRSALPDLSGTSFSLESQLDSFMSANIRDCLNFTEFQENVTAGNVTVRTKINENDVTSVMNVTILIDGTPVTEMTDFKAVRKIRLRNIYDFVNELISKDNSLLLFNLANDYKTVLSWRPGFALSVINVSNSTDIIVVNDSLSSLYAENYLFVFARENRPPVISFIPDKQSLQATTISPELYDPDEDALSHSIVWYNNAVSDTSPVPTSCPKIGSDYVCNATINVTDPAGLYDSQNFKVYLPSG